MIAVMDNIMVTKKAAVLVGTAAFFLSIPSAVRAETITLSPAGAWNMDYAEDSCRLARVFGEGEDRVAFYLERYGPGDRLHMLVAGKPLGKSSRSETRVQFGIEDTPYEYEPTLGDFGTFSPALIFSGAYPSAQKAKIALTEKKGKDEYEEFVDPRIFAHDVTEDQLAAIEWVAFERRGGRRLVLELPQFAQAMKALETCTEELVSHWNIDVEAHRSLTRLPIPENSPGSWLRAEDYPVGLLSKGAQGIVHFRLDVDATGKVTGCHIQRSTRPEGFDKVVCEKISQRAKFEPALDRGGKAIASFYRSTVRFMLA